MRCIQYNIHLLIHKLILIHRCQSCQALNEEQKTAVENIVMANNHPHPYILFGPPGWFLIDLNLKTSSKQL